MARKSQHIHGGVGGHGFPGTLTNQVGPTPAGKPGGGGSKASAADGHYKGMNKGPSGTSIGQPGLPKKGANVSAQRVNLSKQPPSKPPIADRKNGY